MKKAGENAPSRRGQFALSLTPFARTENQKYIRAALVYVPIIKSFAQAFSKACGFQRQSLWWVLRATPLTIIVYGEPLAWVPRNYYYEEDLLLDFSELLDSALLSDFSELLDSALLLDVAVLLCAELSEENTSIVLR